MVPLFTAPATARGLPRRSTEIPQKIFCIGRVARKRIEVHSQALRALEMKPFIYLKLSKPAMIAHDTAVGPELFTARLAAGDCAKSVRANAAREQPIRNKRRKRGQRSDGTSIHRESPFTVTTMAAAVCLAYCRFSSYAQKDEVLVVFSSHKSRIARQPAPVPHLSSN